MYKNIFINEGKKKNSLIWLLLRDYGFYLEMASNFGYEKKLKFVYIYQTSLNLSSCHTPTTS